MMGAKSITIASLCYKPHSCIKPDFYAFETTSWVVFPHEIREFTQESYNKWKKDKISENEIRKRLDELGIPDAQVKYFIDKIK